MSNLPCKSFVAIGLGLACLGCAESATPPATAPTQLASTTAPAQEVTAAQSPPATAASGPAAGLITPAVLESKASEPTLAESAEQAPAEAVEPQSAYQAPFPDRVDLFVPPKRQGGVVLKEGESEESVELLGFVRLDRQQVVLSINGEVTRISEGATQNGIEVISIQPPKVLLQRGRQRWQASLEN